MYDNNVDDVCKKSSYIFNEISSSRVQQLIRSVKLSLKYSILKYKVIV